ncbi:MAG TPA: hypothetical protein VNT32_06965 [Thermoleophilaceae bacterium]|nr:hypothetical protein [Thermoleophilaceae bacterium]
MTRLTSQSLRQLGDALLAPEGARAVPFHAHPAVEMTLATVLLAAAALADLAIGARVLVGAAGMAMIGLALGASASPLRHARHDTAYLIGLLAAAVAMMAAGEPTGGLVLALGALAHGLLASLTSYTRRGI